MQEAICKRAIKTYGENHQMIQCIEEMSELTKALTKYIGRNPKEVFCIDDIAEEIADVEIMIYQLKMILGFEEHIEKIKEYKLKRLENRLDELCQKERDNSGKTESL